MPVKNIVSTRDKAQPDDPKTSLKASSWHLTPPSHWLWFTPESEHDLTHSPVEGNCNHKQKEVNTHRVMLGDGCLGPGKVVEAGNQL